MRSNEIRQRFLDHFARRGHAVVASASLVPDDPSLLFTNAGMVQFKDVFLGLETRGYGRAVSVQKCMRVSGKHNDLENVGPSPRHHTFFEMLGNFSFGDYFKAEAIDHGWSFVVDEMGLPRDRLVLTVHRDDDEAYEVWTRGIGVGADRVLRMGDKTNFWMMADVGPCGPTSEIHYDLGLERCSCGRSDCSVALDNGCDRWLELWNLVFMQYDQLADGSRQPLPRTGVDTGMGLERMAAVMQGADSNYGTDLFGPILDHVQRRAGHDDDERRAHRIGYRVLADHARAMTFLISDGVLPGNEGRGYVLRLIMRRAMRFGRLVGLDTPHLGSLADAVIENMSAAYPELAGRAAWVRQVAGEEESRFQRTLEAGMTLLDDLLSDLRRQGNGVVPGSEVFRLYDTYGFPPDLTQVVAEEQGMAIDRSGFEASMAVQRERGRAGAGFRADELGEMYRRMALAESRFVGYETLDAEGRVLALVADGESVEALPVGSTGQVVLDVTPFYAEAGGQVGDTGTLIGDGLEARVLDTRLPIAGLITHHVRVEQGTMLLGQTVRASVDGDRRLDIARNHTATHLLHRSLERVLGEHAEQRGSLVAPDRLRFDFAHLRALDASELVEIESMVNDMIRADAPVGFSTVSLNEARERGAKMLFGEKYRDQVRLVAVDALSKELCGGTHVNRTGQIGLFLVRSEGSVGAGLRRIEAVTGRAAVRLARDRLDLVERLAVQASAQDADRLPARLDELLQRNRELERQLEEERTTGARDRAAAFSADVVRVGGASVLAAVVAADGGAALRGQIDVLRESIDAGVIALGAVVDGRTRVVVWVADDLLPRGVSADRLAVELAGLLGGRGGGRPRLAEAGGQEPELLPSALARVPSMVGAAMGLDAGQGDVSD